MHASATFVTPVTSQTVPRRRPASSPGPCGPFLQPRRRWDSMRDAAPSEELTDIWPARRPLTDVPSAPLTERSRAAGPTLTAAEASPHLPSRAAPGARPWSRPRSTKQSSAEREVKAPPKVTRLRRGRDLRAVLTARLARRARSSEPTRASFRSLNFWAEDLPDQISKQLSEQLPTGAHTQATRARHAGTASRARTQPMLTTAVNQHQHSLRSSLMRTFCRVEPLPLSLPPFLPLNHDLCSQTS